MKTRESGMPGEGMWEGFFDAPEVLRKLGLGEAGGDVVDFGCGYGTFAIPAARVVREAGGVVHAIDIEAGMVEATLAKARALGVENVRGVVRDFVSEGTALGEGSVGYVMMFNILHAEEPLVLLREARRVLRVGGKLAVMHCNYDARTPRGPSMGIRPRPEMIRGWAEEAGFVLEGGVVDLPPFHYGMIFSR